MKLTNRQQYVLWATVRHYVATAEPVGSKALVEEYNLSVSPATIRNAMGALEKSGLLYQPYTSAGRVPSDSGYRIYVNKLIAPSPKLARQVGHMLAEQINWKDWSLEAILQGATQLLATVSGCIALITMPQTQAARLRHLQLVQIDPGQVMLIAVTDSYETQSVLMQLPASAEGNPPDAEIVERELHILSNFLNSQLQGRVLTELASLGWSELDREFKRYADCLRTLLKSLTRRAQQPVSTQLMIRGMTEVLRQPEFSELQQVQALIQLFEEEQDQIRTLIFDNPEEAGQTDRRVTIRIGSENPLEPMHACTLISSPYKRGVDPIGSVGVLGPTRMDYEGAIAIVEAAADYLSEALSA